MLLQKLNAITCHEHVEMVAMSSSVGGCVTARAMASAGTCAYQRQQHARHQSQSPSARCCHVQLRSSHRSVV